jgi:hypothetical protein
MHQSPVIQGSSMEHSPPSDILAEILRLATRIDVLSRLEHQMAHWKTATTGQIISLLSHYCSQSSLERLSERELKTLRRQLRILGISSVEIDTAIAQSCLSLETKRTIITTAHAQKELKELPKEILEKGVFLGRPTKQTGSLFKSTKQGVKNGKPVVRPIVKGERDENNPNHWYWWYGYKAWIDDQWVSRSKSVPRKKLRLVEEAIADSTPVAKVLTWLSKKSC